MRNLPICELTVCHEQHEDLTETLDKKKIWRQNVMDSSRIDVQKRFNNDDKAKTRIGDTNT